MQLAFIIIFAATLIITISCIFLFKKYKQDYVKSLNIKSSSVRFLSGFSALCTDFLYKLSLFKNSNSFKKTKRHISSLNIGESPDKCLYAHHLQLVSYAVITICLSSFLGLAYTLSILDGSTNSVVEITRPSNGDGEQNISLKTDSELYSGDINITIKDRNYTFDEVMDIFSSYRSKFDSYVLNENSSFLHIDSSLNLPSVWGKENISISWFISATDVIDYSGQLIDKNISSEGVPVELVATLTLDDISADICYQLIIFPSKTTNKEQLESYLNDIINSEYNLTKDTIALPDNILGFDISYSSKNTVYPSMDIYTRRLYSYYLYIFT